jgi:flagellar motor switch protein FliG
MTLALDNRRKAATVLVALGPDRAASFLRNLDEREIQDLMAEVASIGPMADTEVAAVLREVAEEVVGRRIAAQGGVGYARDLLERVLGPARADEVAQRIDPSRRPFQYLASADPEVVAQVLAPEPPSSIALALAHIDATPAAKILVFLPPEVRAEVAMRVAALQHTLPDVVAAVDADLSRRLTPLLQQDVNEVQGLDLLIGILGRASKATEKELLEAIDGQDADLAARIRDALFTFDDIVRLDDRSIQQVLKSVDTRDLATSMKTAPRAVSECILRNLSERARDNLVEEIEFLKGLRPSDIDEARARIVRAIRTLEDAGTISIERPDAEDA